MCNFFFLPMVEQKRKKNSWLTFIYLLMFHFPFSPRRKDLPISKFKALLEMLNYLCTVRGGPECEENQRMAVELPLKARGGVAEWGWEQQISDGREGESREAEWVWMTTG